MDDKMKGFVKVIPYDSEWDNDMIPGESTMDNNRLYDLKQNPLAALHQWVVICSQKKAKY